jgi:hypothetical protein
MLGCTSGLEYDPPRLGIESRAQPERSNRFSRTKTIAASVVNEINPLPPIQRYKVVLVDIHRTSGHTLLDDAATLAVQGWRYESPRSGQPHEFAVPVSFVMPRR